MLTRCVYLAAAVYYYLTLAFRKTWHLRIYAPADHVLGLLSLFGPECLEEGLILHSCYFVFTVPVIALTSLEVPVPTNIPNAAPPKQ